MKVADALRTVHTVFLDTAPVIYFVERNATYFDRVREFFLGLDSGTLLAITSPITLGECLVHPFRFGRTALLAAFTNAIVTGPSVTFATIGDGIATHAAQLRATYGLQLPDALQVATALAFGCDAFLTNDAQFKRVTELPILVLDDLEL